MQMWKRNAVVAAVVLFVCVAVYLTWSYNQNELTPVLNPYGESTAEVAKTTGMQNTTMPNSNSNESINPSQGTTAAPKSESNPYFDEARLNRQQARDSALDVLRESSTNEAASPEARELAMAEMEIVASNALTEARVESLVKAKGFADCVVYLTSNDANVVVTAPVNGLLASDVAKIHDIVISETGGGIVDIKVVEVR